MGANKIYYRHIDGLRALAVLSVLVYHLNAKWLPGGFAGVDIFFVISGFVVTASNPYFGKGLFQFISNFYAKRFTRIIPALVLTLLLTTLFAVLFIPGQGEVAAFKKITAGAHFAYSNFVLVKESTDYFSPLAEFNPFTHTWSLSVEEQFYFIFPLIFLIASFFSKNAIVSFFTFLLLTFLSVLYSRLTDDKAQTFYYITARFWEIGLGVVTYQLFQLIPSHAFYRCFDKIPPSILFLVLILGIFFSSPDSFPDAWLIAIALATALILLKEGRGALTGFVSKLLTRRWVTFVGKCSYSIYLFHWPVIVLLKWTIGLDRFSGLITALLITFSLSFFSYFFIEKPVQKCRSAFKLSHLTTIVLGFGFLISSDFLCSKLYENQTSISLSKVIQKPALWEPHEVYDKDGCTVVGKSLGPYELQISREGPCKDKNNRKRIYVVGDSHVGSYGSLFEKLTAEYGYETHLISKAGCPVITYYDGYSAECSTFAKKFIQKISAEASPGDIVFLPALRMRRLSDRLHVLNVVKKGEITPEILNKTVEDSVELLAPLVQRNIIVVLEAPKPLFRASAFRCYDWFNKDNLHCQGLTVDRNELLNYRSSVMRLFESLVLNSPEIVVWDPFADLCPDGPFCSAWRDGKPLFYDSDHLSSYGSLLLYPSFLKFIKDKSPDQ